MPDEGHVHEPVAAVAAPTGAAPVATGSIALPGLVRSLTASHVLALSRTIGNAAVARAMASQESPLARTDRGTGELRSRTARPSARLAREPAPAAAPAAPAGAPAGGVPAPPVAGAPELSRAPFAQLLGVVEGWSPREEWLQAHLATPGVDGKRLNLADTIVMRKETGVDEAGVVEIAQELYIVGTPVGDRDAVFTYLGFGGLALPSNIEALATASAANAAAIATMSSFEERAAAVLGPINARLSAVGVPTIATITKESGGNAHFNKKSWTISVDADFAMRREPSAPGELLAAVYHEARHAEQDFLVARHMARDQSAAEIASAHGIPPEVAAAAKASPLPENDPQVALAERLRGPIPDEGPDPEFAKIRDRLVDKKARGEKFTPEEDAILAKAFARYKNRPHEADAFLVEALVKQGQALH